jgi:hypothetical protein
MGSLFLISFFHAAVDKIEFNVVWIVFIVHFSELVHNLFPPFGNSLNNVGSFFGYNVIQK